MTLPVSYKVLELKWESYQKNVGWHEYRGRCERASEKKKEFLSEMSQSSSWQATEDASEKNAC